MFIQTQETPNPNAIKFLPSRSVAEKPEYFTSKEDAKNSFLARKILSIKGVESVFFGSDFVTVSKNDEMSWAILKSEIIMIMMDHFVSGLDSYDKIEKEEKKISNVPQNEIERQIVEIIETKVRPAVAQDGGDIIFNSFEDGVVKLELKGACSGCPSSTITLKNGIESMLKYYVPEVKEVEAV